MEIYKVVLDVSIWAKVVDQPTKIDQPTCVLSIAEESRNDLRLSFNLRDQHIN